MNKTANYDVRRRSVDQKKCPTVVDTDAIKNVSII